MNRIVLFVLLLLFWVALTWTGTSPDGAYWQDLSVGLVVAALVTLVIGDSADQRAVPWLQPPRYVWGLVYLLVLAAYVVKANLEVAYRVLHPRLPIRPGIVRLKTTLHSRAARTVLGNSITLCPGTLTVDIWEDGTMMVHWIHVSTEDEEAARRRLIGRFEWFIERIFE